MKIHFMTLCRNEKYLDELIANLRIYDPSVSLTAMREAKSITSGYNALAESAPEDSDVFCFIHEDARLHFDFKTLLPALLQVQQNKYCSILLQATIRKQQLHRHTGLLIARHIILPGCCSSF